MKIITIENFLRLVRSLKAIQRELSGMIRKNRKNSLRVEAYGCEPGCQGCKCKFKIKINRKWIQDDSSDAAAFKKDWLKRFNRVYFNSTDKDGNQHEDVIPNFNVFQKPDDANSKIQVTCYKGVGNIRTGNIRTDS